MDRTTKLVRLSSQISKFIADKQLDKDEIVDTSEAGVVGFKLGDFIVPRPVNDDNLSKLLTLETALEYLVKAQPDEHRDYSKPVPPGTPQYTGTQGGRYFYPSEIGTSDAELGEEVERTVVAAPDPIQDRAVNVSTDLRKQIDSVTTVDDLVKFFERTRDDFDDLRDSHPSIFRDDIAAPLYDKLLEINGPSEVDARPKGRADSHMRSKLIGSGNRDVALKAFNLEKNWALKAVALINLGREDFAEAFLSAKDDIESAQYYKYSQGLNPRSTMPYNEIRLADRIVTDDHSPELIDALLKMKPTSYTAAIIRESVKYLPFDNAVDIVDKLESRAGRMAISGGYKYQDASGISSQFLEQELGAIRFNLQQRKEIADLIPKEAIDHFKETGNLLSPEKWDSVSNRFSSLTDIVEELVDLKTKDPSQTLVQIIDELYSHTKFNWLHIRSKAEWEDSSSTDLGGLLKESIGRQMDGDVLYHAGLLNPESINKSLDNIAHVHETEVPQESLDAYVRFHRNLTRNMLDMFYPDTDTFEIYRGLGHQDLYEDHEQIFENFTYPGYGEAEFAPAEGDVTQNPVSSWSLRYDTAEGFTKGEQYPVVLKSTVDKDHLWSFFGSHAYDGNEREMMVINDAESEGQKNTEIALIDYGESTPDRSDDQELDEEDFNPEDFGEFVFAESEVEVDMKKPERRKVYILDDSKNEDWIKYVRNERIKNQSKKDEAPKRGD